MEIEALIRRCSKRGANLVPDGHRLRVRNWSTLSPALQETLRSHKDQVLEYLADHNPWSVDPEAAKLLSWASLMAEDDKEIETPVVYVEAPLRKITTTRVSYYAGYYLKLIVYSLLQQQTRGWGQFDATWWHRQEEEAFGALRSLQEAVELRGKGQGSEDVDGD